MRNNKINSQSTQKDFTKAASRTYKDIFRYRASPALRLGEWNYSSPHTELSRYTCSKLYIVYPQGLFYCRKNSGCKILKQWSVPKISCTMQEGGSSSWAISRSILWKVYIKATIQILAACVNCVESCTPKQAYRSWLNTASYPSSCYWKGK